MASQNWMMQSPRVLSEKLLSLGLSSHKLITVFIYSYSAEMLYKPVCDIMHECAQCLTRHFNIVNILLPLFRFYEELEEKQAYVARFSPRKLSISHVLKVTNSFPI